MPPRTWQGCENTLPLADGQHHYTSINPHACSVTVALSDRSRPSPSQLVRHGVFVVKNGLEDSSSGPTLQNPVIRDQRLSAIVTSRRELTTQRIMIDDTLSLHQVERDSQQTPSAPGITLLLIGEEHETVEPRLSTSTSMTRRSQWMMLTSARRFLDHLNQTQHALVGSYFRANMKSRSPSMIPVAAIDFVLNQQVRGGILKSAMFVDRVDRCSSIRAPSVRGFAHAPIVARGLKLISCMTPGHKRMSDRAELLRLRKAFLPPGAHSVMSSSPIVMMCDTSFSSSCIEISR